MQGVQKREKQCVELSWDIATLPSTHYFSKRTFNEPVNERQILPVFSAAETGVKHISDSQQHLHLSNKIRKEWKAGKSGICLRRYALRLTFSWEMI